MTDAQRAGKGMGVAEAMNIVGGSCMCPACKQALATIASKLEAADRLAEVASRAVKIVGDRAAGGRMLTPIGDAMKIGDQLRSALAAYTTPNPGKGEL